MSHPSEPDPLDELGSLAAEVAELLRVEHEIGAIGVLSLEAPALAIEPPMHVRSERSSPSASAPAEATPPPFAPRERAPVAPRPVEVSLGEVDDLLARARRARRPASPPVTSPPAPEAVVAAPSSEAAPAALPTAPSASMGEGRLRVLSELAREAAGCTACRLHESRTKSVFSRGSAMAELMFIGEGPGFNEDKKGEPFVGAAGQLLDKMIGAMGYGRDAVYVCNVVKCRPPENRTPLPDEAAACGRFLDGQIEAIQPRMIVALGRCAAERLGCVETGRSWRGSWGEHRGIPVMPTYHPAYLLRNAEMKRPVWEDLQKVTARLKGAGSA